MSYRAELPTVYLDECPACEERRELCRHCGYCAHDCLSDESQRDFDSEAEILAKVGAPKKRRSYLQIQIKI